MMTSLDVSTVTIAAAWSLAWFVVGVIAGRQLSGKTSAGASPRSRRDRKRGSDRSSSRRNDDEIYAGNLSYEATEKDIEKVFATYGAVTSVRLIRNKFNDKSKGYAFVRMRDFEEGRKAIAALNGSEMKGRKIVVNRAKSKGR